MIILHYIAGLFAGLLLCNSIPHLVNGVCGESFPTPFGKPSGIGHSSALVNFLWGFFNLVAGLILCSLSRIAIGFNLEFAVFLTGVLLMGAFSARHFESVRLNEKDKQ
jgi:hypothetical protein